MLYDHCGNTEVASARLWELTRLVAANCEAVFGFEMRRRRISGYEAAEMIGYELARRFVDMEAVRGGPAVKCEGRAIDADS
jgi:hypothetical protein